MVEIEVLEESDSSDSSWEEVVVGVNDEDVDLATTQKAKGPSLSKKKRAASEKTGESVAPPTEPTAPKLATRPSSGAGVTSKKTSQKLDAKNKEKESSGSVLVVALIVVIIALVAFPSLLKTAPSESEEEQVENLYEVLQVAKTATEKEIRNSHRALALKLHPDKNPNCADCQKKFALVSTAYRVLSNPQKRREYDQQNDNVDAISSNSRNLRMHDIEAIRKEGKELWILQVYADWDRDSNVFSTSWELAVDSTKGLFNLGRVNFAVERRFGMEHAKMDARTNRYKLPFLVAIYGNATEPFHFIEGDCSERNPFKVLGIKESHSRKTASDAYNKIKSAFETAPKDCVECQERLQRAHEALETLSSSSKLVRQKREGAAVCVSNFILDSLTQSGVVETGGNKYGACSSAPFFSIIRTEEELKKFVEGASAPCTKILLTTPSLEDPLTLRFASAALNSDKFRTVFALSLLGNSPLLPPPKSKGRYQLVTFGANGPVSLDVEKWTVEKFGDSFATAVSGVVVELTKTGFEGQCWVEGGEDGGCEGCLLYVPPAKTDPSATADNILRPLVAFDAKNHKSVCASFWLDSAFQSAFVDSIRNGDSSFGESDHVVFVSKAGYYSGVSGASPKEYFDQAEEKAKPWLTDPKSLLLDRSPPLSSSKMVRKMAAVALLALAAFFFMRKRRGEEDGSNDKKTKKKK